jgi:protein SCO1/2
LSESPRSVTHRLAWPLLAVLAVAVVGGGYLLGEAFRPATPVASGDSARARQVGGEFTLVGPGGQPVSLSDFRGRAVMLYFGYTFCPDLCPQYLHTMKTLHGELGEEAKHLQVILVSLDPRRDTPQRLREYVRFFDESFLGLTGTRAQIDAVVRDYGAAYNIGREDVPGQYLVDHTSLGYLIDGKGEVRHLLAHATGMEELLTLTREVIAGL